MKYFTFLFLCLFSFPGLAQLDTLHYIAPMHARVYGSPYPATQNHLLSISTPSTANVAYTIKQVDGIVLQSGVFNNNSPVNYLVGQNNNNPLHVSENQLNTINSDKGLVVETGEPSFVAYRNLSVNDLTLNSPQAELMFSKGLTALGTSFRVGGVPNAIGGFYRANFFSVLAIENNTEVDISGWPTGIQLMGQPILSPTGTTTYNLNAGESVVFALYNNNNANLDGHLGLDIQSSKEIVVQNGSNHGSMIPNAQAQDILMEQIVPVHRTGKEYILSRGEEVDDVEVAILIATENGTDVFLNGSGTPQFSLDAGDYQVIHGSNYNSDGVMYIESTENLYCYQQIGGLNNAGKNTGLILNTPLSCGLIDRYEFLHSLNTWQNNTFNCVLNISSRVTDTVFVNYGSGQVMTFLPGTGTSVPGNSLWEVHRATGVTGNFSVESGSGILLDIYGTDHNASYASSFGGYSTQPGSRFVSADTACPGVPFEVSFEYTGLDSSNYSLDFGNAQVLSGSELGPYELDYSTNGQYQVVLVETNSLCPDTHVVEVFVGDEPTPSWNHIDPLVICPDEEVLIYLDSNFTYENVTWSDGSGGYSFWADSPGPVWFEVEGRCGDYSDTLMVEEGVGCVEISLELPNVFTPNGDGYNEVWWPLSEGAERYEIIVYNRWGTEVHQYSGTVADYLGWDGKNVSEGTYFVICKAQSAIGETLEATGHITVIE